MRQGRCLGAALLAAGATAIWAQESKLAVTNPAWNGIEIRFVTRVEPPGPSAGNRLPGAVITAPDRAHHVIQDTANKRYFGYDLRLEPHPDGNMATLLIEPLNLASARITIEPGWTLLAPLKYPVIPNIKVGDTVALDLLVNPATRQKIVDYLTLRRNAIETEAARDFSLADVELTLDQPRVHMNGKLVEATANHSGRTSGAVAWFYLQGHGRFILSLFPNPKLGFQQNGVTAADTLILREGSMEYRVTCAKNVAPGSGPYNLYVLREPGYRPGPMGEPFMVGSADKAEWIVSKR